MKIDFRIIVSKHLRTLADAQTGKLSVWDMIVFFAFPLAAGTYVYLEQLKVSKEVHNLSVTFFGIFVALLLNIQVAIFGVYARNPRSPADGLNKAVFDKKIEDRRKILRELNTNISYLTLIGCLALFVMIFLFGRELESPLPSAISVAVFIHFLLTLLMVTKRAFILFDVEYSQMNG